jgi:hypothetical protein
MSEEASMSIYCRMCGRPIEGGDDICEVCKESVRAEAMGRQTRIAQETPKEAVQSGIRERKRAKTAAPPASQSQDQEREKKPHHFKSMAEYLDYLKGKK